MKNKKYIYVKGNKVSLTPSRKIPAMKYHDYITSAYWKARRLRYFHFNDRACSICGETENVQLHHLCYDPKMYGAEPDEDFAPLCRTHHHMFHQVHNGVPPRMKEKTQAFIEHMKQLERSNLDDLSWI